MKLSLCALLVGSAAAFSPSSNVAPRTSVAQKMSFENELGSQPPIGFWDPLGFLTNVDENTFERYRTAEIKHGRVSMLAFVGHLVTSLGIRFPGYLSTTEDVKFEDVPAGLGAIAKVPSAGLLQIFLLCGLLEISGFKRAEGAAPGDFTGSPFPVDFIDPTYTDERKLFLRGVELNNGRAAQMGILALVVHEYNFGKPWIFFDA